MKCNNPYNTISEPIMIHFPKTPSRIRRGFRVKTMHEMSGRVVWANDVSPMSYNTVCASYADDKTPVVILIHVKENGKDTLPFIEHNYLRYFRKIYETKGWTTIQCTPTDDVTSKEEKCAQTVQSVMAYLESRDLHRNPIFFHLLGPRSVSVYNEFTHVIGMEREDIFQVTGAILDSCPSRPRGVLVSLRKTFPTVYNIVMAILYIMTLAFPEFFNPPTDLDSYKRFCYNKCACPQLFLYSTSDHLVDPTDVEFVINQRHHAGVAIDRKCWTDSEHARHLFSHEQEYTVVCQEFIQKQLRR